MKKQFNFFNLLLPSLEDFMPSQKALQEIMTLQEIINNSITSQPPERARTFREVLEVEKEKAFFESK